MENREEAIAQIVELLEITPEAIEKKLSAKWVKDDSFVPIKTIPRVEEIELMSISPDEEVLKENERHEKLLEIPGVMISDVEVREYPLGEAAAHLVGYVQSVTAEDLEEHAGEGYTSNSVIGRRGMEGLFESELKGQNGCRIYIVNSEGKEKEELACILVQHGQDIQLTIDADLPISLYEQFKEDKSCSVTMNPYTGEVLALVSTPAYDNNDLLWDCPVNSGLRLTRMRISQCIIGFGKCGVRGLHSSQLPLRSAWNQEQSIQWKITGT